MSNASKQKTIGASPLDDYLSHVQSPSEGDLSDPVVPEPEEQAPVKKQRVTFHVPIDLMDKVKNAVYWEPGLTLASFAEIALEKYLQEMEDERGKPFTQRRDHRLRGGRPIK